MENHAAGSAANRPLDGIDVPAYLTAILFGLAHILCVSLEIDNSPLPPPTTKARSITPSIRFPAGSFVEIGSSRYVELARCARSSKGC